MAGNFNNLANEMVKSASRLKTNINSLINKYDRSFHDDDLISLSSMSICRLSSKGTLRKIKGRHDFGASKLKTTKKKEELLKLKLGFQKNKVDLNVSRAIERECAVALADLDEASGDEPSDAETLSSFDEENFEEREDSEESGREANDSVSVSDSFKQTDDVQITEISSSENDGSITLDSSRDSYGSEKSENEFSDNESQRKVFNETVTLDNVVEGIASKGVVSHNDQISYGRKKALETTFVLNSKTNSQQTDAGILNYNNDVSVNDQSKEDIESSFAATEISHSHKSFVSISSPRPKVKYGNQNLESKSRLNFPLSVPKKLGPNQTFVGPKSKFVAAGADKSDVTFKSPQGIRLKRVYPVFVGPISSSKPSLVSPKDSSHSSGFSSCSSPSKTREKISNTNKTSISDTNSRSERVQLNPIHDDVRYSDGCKDQYPLINKETLPLHGSDSSLLVRTKFSRVGQWVDLVNTSVSNKPLYYPSCPPKVPGQFSSLQHVSQIQPVRKPTLQHVSQIQPVRKPTLQHVSQIQPVRKPTLQHVSQIQPVRKPTLQLPSPSNKQRDIGIQTNLNTTVESTKKDFRPKKMKDVSIVLSNSFLEAHSHSKLSFHNEKVTVPKERYDLKYVKNTMFPEEYIFQFSPLNPNRIDSDESSNLHQAHCLKDGLRNFRPRRNVKRPFVADIENDTWLSTRPSKYRKTNFADLESRDLSSVAPKSIGNNLNDTYIVHSSTRMAHNNSSPYQTGNTCKKRNTIIPSPRSNLNRASTPLCMDGGGNSNGFVNSSVSETGIVSGYNNEEDFDQSLIHPKLDVFLSSNKHQNRHGSSTFACRSKSERKIQNRCLTDGSFGNDINRVYTKTKSNSSLKERQKTSNIGGSSQFMSTNDGLAGEDAQSDYLPSMSSWCQMNKSVVAEHEKYSETRGKNFVPSFSLSLNQSLSKEELGEENSVRSGSFLDAHTPKPKLPSLLLSAEQDLSNEYRNKHTEISQSPSTGRSLTRVRPVFNKKKESIDEEMTQRFTSLSEYSSHQSLAERFVNSTISHKDGNKVNSDHILNGLGLGHQSEKVKDISFVEESVHNAEDSMHSHDKDSSTEEYSLNEYESNGENSFHPGQASVCDSSDRGSCSGMVLLDNSLSSLSTIHGTDNEVEIDSDEDVDYYCKPKNKRNLESELSFTISSLNSMRYRGSGRKEINSSCNSRGSLVSNGYCSKQNDTKYSTQHNKYPQILRCQRNDDVEKSIQQESFVGGRRSKEQMKQTCCCYNNHNCNHNKSKNMFSNSKQLTRRPQPQNSSMLFVERTDALQKDMKRFLRSSTPMLRNSTLNNSMSTIFGLQDENSDIGDSDESEEDWNSMLIKDVDVIY